MKGFISGLFLFISFFANAQKEVFFQKEPLILVNNFKTNSSSLIIRPNSIDSIKMITDSVYKVPYGFEGKDGVILIFAKKNANLLTAADIINKYKIDAKDSNLRFAIDRTVIKDKSKILIEKGEIFTVSVTTDIHWVNVEDANSNERFINITTIEKKEK